MHWFFLPPFQNEINRIVTLFIFEIENNCLMKTAQWRVTTPLKFYDKTNSLAFTHHLTYLSQDEIATNFFRIKGKSTRSIN